MQSLSVRAVQAAALQVRPAASISLRKCNVSISAPVSIRTVAPKASKRPAVRAHAAADGTTKISLAEVQNGSEFEGVVTKVEDFGAFVDIGATSEGMVHISQLSDGYVKSPKDFVQVGQSVKVKVLSVDTTKNRLALTMKGLGAGPAASAGDDEDEGEYFDDEDEGEEEIEELSVPQGYSLVSVPVDGEEMVYALSDELDNLTPEQIAVLESEDLVVEGAPVTGTKVACKALRVTAAGVNVAFEHAGKSYEGFMPASELLAPAETAARLFEEAAERLTSEPSPPSETDEGADDTQDIDIDLSLLEVAEEPEGPADDGEDYYREDMYQEVPGDDAVDATQIYSVGDEFPAFVLEADEEGKITLTQISDEMLDTSYLAASAASAAFPIGADARSMLDDVEEERAGDEDEVDLDDFLATVGTTADTLPASDPEDLTMDEGAEADDVAAVLDASEESELAEQLILADGLVSAAGAKLLRSRRGVYTDAAFPSRPLRAVNDASMLSGFDSKLQSEDFDGDVNELIDYWSLPAVVPKGFLKSQGKKMNISEAGEFEIVDREDFVAAESEDAVATSYTEALAQMTAEARTEAIMQLLLDTEADEAELPFRAYRRPSL